MEPCAPCTTSGEALDRRSARGKARLSRSAFAARGEVAAKVGYESEAAFSKAFKREMGAAPGAWRSAAPA